jgi:hypothetical protein
MFGLLGGILGGVAKAGIGLYQNIKAGQMNPEYVPYQKSPYAEARLGVAQNLFNGRAAGAAAQERNIYASGANATNNINRNATDSSQALALGAGIMGQQANAFNQLGIDEAKNKYNLLDNLNQGYDAQTRENDKVYQDKLMKYKMDKEEQAQLRGAGFSNIFSGFNDAMGTMAQNDQQKKQDIFNSKYLSLLGG